MKAGCLLSTLFLPMALWGQARPVPPLPVPDDSILVSSEWLASRLGDTALTIIQIEGSTETWARGHIPGAQPLAFSAIVVNRGNLTAEFPPVETLDSVLESVGIATGRRIVIYGEPLYASRLFYTLDYLGLGDRAAILDGGLSKWQAEGRPVTTDTTPARRGEFEPRVRHALLVDGAWVQQHLADSLTVLLDARSIAEYNGETPGEHIERPGHIPGAVNIYWRELFERHNPPMLIDRPTLRSMLRDARLTPDRRIVVYCRTGTQASWLYFALRNLGYTPALYDASYTEWSADPSLPIEGPTRPADRP
jgi:thiosulfate/3-mercaptopyruvate sulfurtransferase